MTDQRQIDRIQEMSDTLSEMADAYKYLVRDAIGPWDDEAPRLKSQEFLDMVEMSGEMTLDSLNRSATLLEILRVARQRQVEQSFIVPSHLCRPYMRMRMSS